MEITKENIESELLKRIPELHGYKAFSIKVENKEIEFKISSFTDNLFTTEVDIENKNIEQLLNELVPKVRNLVSKVNQKNKTR